MRTKIEFQCNGYGKFWEAAVTNDGESPKDCANRIVKFFNDTLRPGEERRKVTAVRVTEDEKIPFPHTWRKMNSFTIIEKGKGSYDKFECEVCHITGKRLSLDPYIKVDYKFRGKKSCIK